jgi:lipid II:glycine glycyltransferase (peptidoglycan interpeptide bridge formation enzyme)
MDIRQIDDVQWENFVNSLNQNTFLHSLGWVDFNKAFGFKTFQLGLFEGDMLTSVAFAFVIAAKRGRFLFVPHGPQFREFSQSELASWTKYLKRLAKEQNCSFVRISPIEIKSELNTTAFANLGYRPSPIHMHAEHTSVLDLTQELPDILMGMRKTTRQLCNRGEKMIESGEIQIVEHTSFTNELYEVYTSTASRGGFVPFSRAYLQQEYDSFTKFEKCRLISIVFEGRVLSWGFWILAGKRCFYHQGANILDKQVPASYISHYQGIKWAKANGAISYDFWGVGPADEPNHPWANISTFKRGFGGVDVELVHAVDLPISWQYWPTWAFESYRAKRRGF